MKIQTDKASQFVFIENFIQHTFPAKRQYTGIVCCYTEDFFLPEKIKLSSDYAGQLCTALKTNATCLEEKNPTKNLLMEISKNSKIKSHTQEI